MKVLDEYDKRSGQILTINGISIFKIMDQFFKDDELFKNMSPDCRKCYDTNLRTLKLYRVDEMYDGNSAGEYLSDKNIILFKSFNSLVHELMHMASHDMKKANLAFIKETPLFDEGLIEGMTEYLSMRALHEIGPSDYFFEVFTVSMLSEIDQFFEPFFIPNRDKFIGLFPNKIDILSLMYAIDYYFNNNGSNPKDKDDLLPDRMEHSIAGVIDSLLSIELSLETNPGKLKAYQEKFMDLLSDTTLEDTLSEYFKDYKDYAYHEVKKRVLIKR